jgi:hypothetical protein
VKAKGLQREQFITEYGAADGPPAVSPQALKLLRGEAFRCFTLPLLPACLPFCLSTRLFLPLLSAVGCPLVKCVLTVIAVGPQDRRADAQGRGRPAQRQGSSAVGCLISCVVRAAGLGSSLATVRAWEDACE